MATIAHRYWWFRCHRRPSHGFYVRVGLFGYPVDILWDSSFDRRGTGTRAVLSISIENKRGVYGLLIQHYRQGYEFDAHLDGVPHNHVWLAVLKHARCGGELFLEGPHQNRLRRRLWRFDGGQFRHGVTRIEHGSRLSLIFQHAPAI